MHKTKSILLSIVWTIVILIFPVVSGVIAVVFKMNQIETFLIQGCFMLLSLTIPAVYIYIRRVHIKEIGLRKMKSGNIRKTQLLMLLILCELPLILTGVNFKSYTYVSTLAFFTLMVGISEELYFRGIILKLLKDNFPVKQAVAISALIFGIGHIANALSGASTIYVFLQIINAIVFGILATEIVVISKSLIPIIIWHFAFDFINHITLATGITEIFVIGLQEIIMIIYACYLYSKISLGNKDESKLLNYKL